MPRAIPLATRQEISRRHLDGQTLARIALDLHLPHVTVRALWRGFRSRGEEGLDVGYRECGRATPRHDPDVLRRACRLKRKHPTWGAGRVRVELLGPLDPALVPSPRTLQRAFQTEGINRPRRAQRPRSARAKPEAAHDVWEVDAVEKERLKTGEEVSWMSAVDVYSGAHLANRLSPPSPVAGDPPQRRPSLVSPRLSAVGPAADDPRRQRSPLGIEPGIAAGPGVVADRPGRVAGMDPPGSAATERPCRAGQRRDSTVGGTPDVFESCSIAGAIESRVRCSAGALSVGGRAVASGGVSRPPALRSAVSPPGRGRELGSGPRGPIPGRSDPVPPGQRAGRDLALRREP
jgi:hypothetical protein